MIFMDLWRMAELRRPGWDPHNIPLLNVLVIDILQCYDLHESYITRIENIMEWNKKRKYTNPEDIVWYMTRVCQTICYASSPSLSHVMLGLFEDEINL